MSGAPVNRIKVLALGGVLALAVIVLLMVFSGSRAQGSLALTATLSRAFGVGELTYEITGNGIAAIRGRAGVSGPDSATRVKVDDIPAGNGYTLQLSASAANGKIKCARKDTFDVEVDRTTTLEVSVLCRDMSPIAEFVASRNAMTRTLAAVAPPPAPPIEPSPECSACETSNIKSGECEPDSGCDGLQGEDRQLCVNLLNCLRATNCWVKDPLDCLCGTVDYVECIKGGNGACRAELQAATRTTDPIQNGTLFFDPKVPAGRANRLISCDKEKCRSHCSIE